MSTTFFHRSGWVDEMGIATKASLAFLTGLVIGFLSWGEGRNPSFAIFIPILWSMILNPYLNSMLVFGYYLASIRSAAYAAFGYYFESKYHIAIGISLWIAMSAMITVPWLVTSAICSKLELRRPIERVLATMMALIVTMIPPFGIIGVANPLLSLGWFMPGFGWWALMLFFLALAWILFSRHQAKILLALGVMSLVLLDHHEESHQQYGEIEAVSTKWGRPTTMDDIVDRLFLIHDYAQVASKKGVKTIIYPEGILADWKDAYQFTWRTEIESVAKEYQLTIGVGVDEEIGVGRYENALKMTSSAPAILARARQNIPAKMQLPFSDTGFNSDWLRSTQVNIGKYKAMLVFCYEEHLFGLLLLGLFERRPDVMVTVLNSWWANDEKITREVQLRHAESFARLFAIPLIRSENL